MSMQLQLTREASLIIAFTCLQVYVLVKKMIIYHGAVRLQNTPGQWGLVPMQRDSWRVGDKKFTE